MKTLLSAFLFVSFQYTSISQGFLNLSDSLGFNYTYGFGEYGGGPSFVDFDRDGLDDITIPTGNLNFIGFHKNTGDDFEALSPLVLNSGENKQVLWVDYDNDEDLDLYVCSHQLNRLYRNDGDLTFTDITESCGFSDDEDDQSFNAVWFDYDDDGLLDLCVSHRHLHLVGNITLYRNLGGDSFEDVTIEAGLNDLGNSVLAMTSFDFNNDGWEDLYVGQDFGAGNILLKNNGDGTFEDISESSSTDVQNNSMTTTIGDFNNDGWMDIYVTNTSQGNSFFINQGDETFVEMALEYGVKMNQFTWGAVFLDAENDGDLDLYVDGINHPTNTNSPIFENPGDGSPYAEVNSEWGMEDEENSSSGNAIGDWNNDGFPDIIKINDGQNHTFWENQFDSGNYLKINLHGTQSNSMAVGAVLEVRTDGLSQYRRIACGEGFSSQNSYTQLFGLGDNTVVDSLIIQWPSGQVTTMNNINVNQTIEITEDPVPCFGDVNNDNVVNIFDLLLISSNFGCQSGCEGNGDADFNGVIDIMDFLIVSSSYNVICP